MDLYGAICLYTISVVAKRFLRIAKDVSKVVSNVWHRWTRFFLLLSELNITTNTSVILWRHKCQTIHTVKNLSTVSRSGFAILSMGKQKNSWLRGSISAKKPTKNLKLWTLPLEWKTYRWSDWLREWTNQNQ